MAAPSSSPSPSTDPPYYILISQGQSMFNPVPSSTSLSHPLIEYHYADDQPNSLLPKHHGEHVLVLDYDPAQPGTPTIKSLSPDLVVSAVKVADAPGAAIAGEPALRNNSMYVIETMTKPTDNPTGDDDEQQSVHAVLSRFKQRNAVLRRVLEYPSVNGAGSDPQCAISPTSTSPQT